EETGPVNDPFAVAGTCAHDGSVPAGALLALVVRLTEPSKAPTYTTLPLPGATATAVRSSPLGSRLAPARPGWVKSPLIGVQPAPLLVGTVGPRQTRCVVRYRLAGLVGSSAYGM